MFSNMETEVPWHRLSSGKGGEGQCPKNRKLSLWLRHPWGFSIQKNQVGIYVKLRFLGPTSQNSDSVPLGQGRGTCILASTPNGYKADVPQSTVWGCPEVSRISGSHIARLRIYFPCVYIFHFHRLVSHQGIPIDKMFGLVCSSVYASCSSRRVCCQLWECLTGLSMKQSQTISKSSSFCSLNHFKF